MPHSVPRLAVLISGRGRNLRALIEAVGDGRIPARIVKVISSRSEAEGLAIAHAAGIETEIIASNACPDRIAFDRALAASLRQSGAEIIVLAGFMRILSADFVEEFAGRMLNIHPSLLPAYPGLHTHRRALADGLSEHGASVHFVTPELDGGPVVIQGRLCIGTQDDEFSLAERVLEDVELRIYPQAVAWMARGLLTLKKGVIHFKDEPLRLPLTLENLEPEFR